MLAASQGLQEFFSGKDTIEATAAGCNFAETMTLVSLFVRAHEKK